MDFFEIKRRYDGTESVYRCRLLERSAERVVLLYETTEQHVIDKLVLPKGTSTIGFFWTGRPYNVYHWVSPAGETLGYYFNIVEETVIQDDRLSYRGMIVDVISYPDGSFCILDEDELPTSLERFAGGRVKQAVEGIIQSLGTIIREVNRETAQFLSERH